jgi:hypothetical protein
LRLGVLAVCLLLDLLMLVMVLNNLLVLMRLV